MPKLSDDDVRALRRRYGAGEYLEDLAVEFDIDRTYASRVIRGVRRGTAGAHPSQRRPRRIYSWAFGSHKPPKEG